MNPRFAPKSGAPSGGPLGTTFLFLSLGWETTNLNRDFVHEEQHNLRRQVTASRMNAAAQKPRAPSCAFFWRKGGKPQISIGTLFMRSSLTCRCKLRHR